MSEDRLSLKTETRKRLLQLRCRLIHRRRYLHLGWLHVEWGLATICSGSGLCQSCCEEYREFSCENMRRLYPVVESDV